MWEDASWALEPAALEAAVSGAYLTHPGFALNATTGIDLMDPKLDAHVGSPLLPTVAACLASGSLPTCALTLPASARLVDACLPLLSSFLTGNALVSTLGTCLYTHPTALSSLSAALVLARTGLPSYTPAVGPSYPGLPPAFIVKPGTPPPPATVVPLGLVEGGSGTLAASVVYVSCLALLRLAAVAHESIACFPFEEEDHVSTWWLNGHADCAWGVADEDVLRALVRVEAAVTCGGGMGGEGAGRLDGAALMSSTPAAELLGAAPTPPVEGAEDVAHRLRFLRFTLAAYVRMHPGSAVPARKPFRWGCSFDLAGARACLAAAHGSLVAIGASHTEGEVAGVDPAYERVLHAPHRTRCKPLQAFPAALTTLLKHIATGTFVTLLPELATYNPGRRVMGAVDASRGPLPPAWASTAAWPADPQDGDGGGVLREATVLFADAAAVGVRLKAREVLPSLPPSGITDPPLRWPDPTGVPAVVLTRHTWLPPSEQLEGGPALPFRPFFASLPAPPTDVPDFRPLTDAAAFDPTLVAAPRPHISLGALRTALSELAAREPDALLRSWASRTVVAVPPNDVEAMMPPVLRAGGCAVVGGEPDGTLLQPAGGEGVDTEWAASNAWRVAHVSSAVLFGSHTLYEVIAADLADTGVPAELLWSHEGRDFVRLAEAILRYSLHAAATHSRMQLRSKGMELIPELSLLLQEARTWDEQWVRAAEDAGKLANFVAARAGGEGGVFSELMRAPGSDCGPNCTDAPAVPVHTGALLTLAPFVPVPSTDDLQARIARIAPSTLPVDVADPRAFVTVRWPGDARLRRTLRSLKAEEFVLHSSLLHAWSARFASAALYDHVEEGEREGLTHAEEVLAVQKWGEALAFNACKTAMDCEAAARVAEAWPEIRSLTAESSYCAATGAVHSLRRPLDPFVISTIHAATVRAAEEVKGEVPPLEEEVAPLSLKGKSPPPSPAALFLTSVRDRDMALAEGETAVTHARAVLAVVHAARRLSIVPPSGPGRRALALWAATVFVHRLTEYLLLAGSSAGVISLLDVEGFPPAAPGEDGSDRIACVGGEKWAPQSPLPATFRHPGKVYAYRWRWYASLDTTNQPGPPRPPLLRGLLFSWVAYSSHHAAIMASSLPKAVDLERALSQRRNRESTVLSLAIQSRLARMRVCLGEASSHVEQAQGALKAVAKEATATAGGKVPAAGPTGAGPLSPLEGGPPPPYIAPALTWLEGEAAATTAGELLWAATDAARASALLRTTISHSVLLAKVTKSEAFGASMRAVAEADTARWLAGATGVARERATKGLRFKLTPGEPLFPLISL